MNLLHKRKKIFRFRIRNKKTNQQKSENFMIIASINNKKFRKWKSILNELMIMQVKALIYSWNNLILEAKKKLQKLVYKNID